MEFAVEVEGLDNLARWVVAIEGDRFLVVHPDKTFHWHPMSECKFVKGIDPLLPQPVVPVPPPEPQIQKANRLEIIGGNHHA